MSRIYRVTGINLKSIPLGESDRLMTILTPEKGLIRTIAPGARKYQSQLRGRTELFVVNQLIIAKGRSLDKITQAETIISYGGLSNNLAKLAAGQYLAELALGLAIGEQPQGEIYQLLREHLARLEKLDNRESCLPSLTQALFHLLVVGGIAPRVNVCCITQEPLIPQLNQQNWRVGFSFDGGGIISLGAPSSLKIDNQIGAIELALLQQLTTQSLLPTSEILADSISINIINDAWLNLERLLRNYTQYHLGCTIRSATLIDSLSNYASFSL